jgi:hypothetical protein
MLLTLFRAFVVHLAPYRITSPVGTLLGRSGHRHCNGDNRNEQNNDCK